MPADRFADAVEAIRRDVLTAAAVTKREERARAMTGQAPGALGAFLTKVRDASSTVTEADVAGLRAAGLSEDEVYELTVAAAFGVAYERLEAAKRAVKGTS